MDNKNILVGKLSKKRRWFITALLSVSLLIISIDMTILNIALPNLAKDLQTTSEEQLWIIDIYSLMIASFLVPMSALADHFGRKKILLLGFLIFGSISIFILFAKSALFVIILRAILGIGGAMIMPATLSIIRSIFLDPEERAKALGVWAGIASLGVAAGPLIGGVLLEYFSWHFAFLINVPIMFFAIIIGFVLLPEIKVNKSPRWDQVAAVLSIIGMFSFVWSIKNFTKVGMLHLFTWIVFIFAIIILILFVKRCLQTDEPFLNIRLFRQKPFTAGIIAALATMLAMAAVLYLLAQWLQLIEQLTPFEAGIRLLPLAVSSIISSILAPILATKISFRIVLSGGLFISGIGFSILYIGSEITDIIVALALALIGTGVGSLAIGTTIIMSSTTADEASHAAVMEETSYELGNVLGIALLGSVATIVYRMQFTTHSFVERGISLSLLKNSEQSLANALVLAEKMNDVALKELSIQSFIHSIQVTSLIGAFLLMISAVVVYFLIPKSFHL